jgi:hypothetical protein
MARQNSTGRHRAKVTRIRGAEPDLSQLPHHLARMTTDSVADAPSDSDIQRVMAELGRRGGRIGGNKRAASMTPERRREIALKAARTRWDNRKA